MLEKSTKRVWIFSVFRLSQRKTILEKDSMKHNKMLDPLLQQNCSAWLYNCKQTPSLRSPIICHGLKKDLVAVSGIIYFCSYPIGLFKKFDAQKIVSFVNDQSKASTFYTAIGTTKPLPKERLERFSAQLSNPDLDRLLNKALRVWRRLRDTDYRALQVDVL